MRIIDEENLIVGECPIWDDRKKLLYTVDTRGKKVRSTDLRTLEHTETVYDQEVGCLFLRENGGLLAGMQDGVYEIFADGSKKLFAAPEHMKGRRFNDGKVGPDGRIYIGSKSEDHEAAFYRIDTDGTVTELFEHVGCSNGIDWSPDGRTMYYIDSPDRVLEAFDFAAEKGTLTNRRVVMPVNCEKGEYDGMTADSEGMLWIAVWGAWRAYRIDPREKTVLGQLDLPVEKVSCCAFAGDKLDTLIVTSAAFETDLSRQSHAGSTFAFDCAVPGRPVFRFKG